MVNPQKLPDLCNSHERQFHRVSDLHPEQNQPLTPCGGETPTQGFQWCLSQHQFQGHRQTLSRYRRAISLKKNTFLTRLGILTKTKQHIFQFTRGDHVRLCISHGGPSQQSKTLLRTYIKTSSSWPHPAL